MKRIIISFVLLVLILCLAISSGIQIEHVTDRMLSYLDTAERQISIGDSLALNHTVHEMQEYYDRQAAVLLLFVRRDLVAQPQCSLRAMSAYLSLEDTSDLHCELLQARLQLMQLRSLFLSLV